MMQLLFPGLLCLASLQGATDDWQKKFASMEKSGDLFLAVEIVEEHLEDDPDDVEAWRLHARTLERLVTESGASGDVYYDAAESWSRVVALDPFDLDALRSALDMQMRTQEYDAAAVLALHGIGTQLMLEGVVPPDLVDLACRARVAAHVTETFPDDEARARDLERTWALLENARTLEPTRAAPWNTRVSLLDWLGLPERAVQSLVKAIAMNPGEASFHRTLIDIHVREGIEERLPNLYESIGADPTDATFAWYTGYVARLAGDLAEKERRFDAAFDHFRRCQDWMGRAAALEPSFGTSSDSVIHQARTAMAWCWLEAGDLDAAEAYLFSTFTDASERVHERDGLGRSVIDCLAALGDRFVAANDFARGAELARFVTRLVPEDGLWWNNLAFFLREYGTQLHVGALSGVENPEARSRQVFRECWQAYLEATRLTPDTPFVPNDASIIQIYHLEEDLETAERLLYQAIAIGEAQLADMDADADPRERFPVAQAVGDAYQNLGYLYYHVLDEPAKSRPFWVKCKETGGGDRSFVDEYLASIDGEAGPVPLREPAQFVGKPDVPVEEEKERTPIRIWWDRSLEEARGEAGAKQQELLVYYHGHGLGLAIPPLDAFVASEEFSVNNGARVLVVCDYLRHTFVDRRRDGSRVLCPKWGTITCNEHIRSHEEFGAWFEERHGVQPDQPEEGFWLQGNDDDDLHLLVEPEEFQRLIEPLVAGRRDLPPASGDPVAHALLLVSTPLPPARDGVEAALFDPTFDEEGRHALVEALVREKPAWFAELLPTLVRQEAVPTLAEAALRRWATDLDLAPVRFAARWSRDGVVRQLAQEILSREDPEHEAREAARRIVGVR